MLLDGEELFSAAGTVDLTEQDEFRAALVFALYQSLDELIVRVDNLRLWSAAILACFACCKCQRTATPLPGRAVTLAIMRPCEGNGMLVILLCAEYQQYVSCWYWEPTLVLRATSILESFVV